MKFTVRYIPLSKIKADSSIKMSGHIKKLKGFMWDCMNILIVRKNGKDGTYTILSGVDRFTHLRKNPKNIYAPCIVDNDTSVGIRSWLHRFRGKQPLDDFPMLPNSWSIARAFLKEEPTFQNLSRIDQIKVLFLAVRYKRTVIVAMKSKMKSLKNNKKA